MDCVATDPSPSGAPIDSRINNALVPATRIHRFRLDCSGTACRAFDDPPSLVSGHGKPCPYSAAGQSPRGRCCRPAIRTQESRTTPAHRTEQLITPDGRFQRCAVGKHQDRDAITVLLIDLRFGQDIDNFNPERTAARRNLEERQRPFAERTIGLCVERDHSVSTGVSGRAGIRGREHLGDKYVHSGECCQ